MNILMLPPYCYPEQVSSSHLTEDFFNSFRDNDINAEIYTPTPCRGIDKDTRNQYRTIIEETCFDGSVVIHRFHLFAEGKNPLARAFRYVLCNLIQIYKGTKKKSVDIIYSASTPPTQGLMIVTVKKRLNKKLGHYVPFVYNLQDVFPDSLVNAGMTKKGSLTWKIGRKIEDYTYRNADKIIVISEGFKKNIMKKGVPEDKIVIVPNWVNTDNVFPLKREDNKLFERFGLDRSKFYICYSGNLGHSQNLELIIDVAKTIKDTMPNLFFIFVGEGAAKEQFEKTIQDERLDNIKVFPFQPYEDIAAVFSLGDVGLIISKPGIGGSSVPSKTWSIMAAERPILASFDTDSELVSLVNAVGCGLTVEAGNKEKLIDAISNLFADSQLVDKGKLGREYLLTALDKDKCVGKYIETLKSVVE